MLTSRVKARWNGQRGSVLVLVAAGIFPLMILMSFAIDTSHWFDYSRNLQNRADAAAMAGGNQYGGICAQTPTASSMKPVGLMAQLFSGPLGASADLPYPYSGVGSPLAQFPTYGNQYQNVPNLTTGASNGSNYHVLLNAGDYWKPSGGGTNFALGTFCNSNPTLDKTDVECQGPLSGQAAIDCAAGPMVDVKVTQANVPVFFPFVGKPTISARARVVIQGLGQATNLRPLAVRDPGAIPCVKANFYNASTNSLITSVQLSTSNFGPGNTGPIVWDNTGHNGGNGDQVAMPTGANVYVQTVLYAQGNDGTCNTVSNDTTYPQSGGILYIDTYGDPPAAGPPIVDLDPSVDGTLSEWTKSTGSSASALLDDGVRSADPTPPSTAGDLIFSTATGQRQDLSFANTLGYTAGDTYKLWVYGTTSGDKKDEVDYAISTGGAFSANDTLIPAQQGTDWYSVDISSKITSKAALNALQVRLTHVNNGKNPGAQATIYAAYIERTPPVVPQNPALVGAANFGGGVTLLSNGACTSDQYFSSNAACQVKVCAQVWFPASASSKTVSVTGVGAMTANGDPQCTTSVAGATAYASGFIPITQLAGARQFTLTWTADIPNNGCGGGNCRGSFGVEQQAFAACDESQDNCSGQTSGPIVFAEVGTNGLSTVNSYKAGTNPFVTVTLKLQGLQNAAPTDRCPTAHQCTVLRFSNGSSDGGNSNGLVDCGQGNGTGGDGNRAAFLKGCPLFGETTPVSCDNTPYCGSWKPSPNGICHLQPTRTSSNTAVDCVNSNNGGSTIPNCMGALAQTGGSVNMSNCHVSGGTCAPDHWTDGVGPQAGDPRIITSFIVYPGDLSAANGNTDIPIRIFASFYVTGWQTPGNDQGPDCSSENEPAPAGVRNNDNAIWGHWFTYAEPGGTTNGQPCNFAVFGDCTLALTR